MNRTANNNIIAELYASQVRHSLSPLIHNTGFRAVNIQGTYGVKEVNQDNLASEFSRLRESSMLGINLSMPNKIVAVNYVDELSDVSQLVGAINTVVNQNGYLIGHNTDGIGFAKGLESKGYSLENKSFVILGCGGAALAIISHLAILGVAKISVIKRKNTTYRAAEKKLIEIMAHTGAQIELFNFSQTTEIQGLLDTSDYLVNCTNSGMTHVEQTSPLEESYLLHSKLIVIDIIYDPQVTPFLLWAQKQGCKTENGLSMLVFQAAEAFELWTGLKMPIKKVVATLKNEEIT